MNIYEIDNQIISLFDPETGELLDEAAYESLQMAREQKLENLAAWIINLKAEAKAIKEQEDKLSERRTSLLNSAENKAAFLDKVLMGQSFKTAKVACTYRKSSAVQIEDENAFIEWAKKKAPELLTAKEPTISKSNVKEAILSGAEIKDAAIVEKHNLSIN